MNPYSRITEIMEERGAALNGYAMVQAVIINTDPLTIKIGEALISVNIYINPVLSLKIDLDIQTEETGLKECIKQMYKAVKIEIGDEVIVQRVGNIFYILSKVVKG